MKQSLPIFRILALCTLMFSAHAMAAGQATDPSSSTRPIDKDRSTLTVRVMKSGLFSAFAHNHEISAPLTGGTIVTENAGKTGNVSLTVDARQLTVLDPEASASTRADIQKTMHSAKVLDSENFKEIKFVSTAVKPSSGGRYAVTGDLTLHGQTHSVQVDVVFSDGHYRGSATVKQTDFGITPISIGGGSIKVKDEVKIEFDIVVR